MLPLRLHELELCGLNKPVQAVLVRLSASSAPVAPAEAVGTVTWMEGALMAPIVTTAADAAAHAVASGPAAGADPGLVQSALVAMGSVARATSSRRTELGRELPVPDRLRWQMRWLPVPTFARVPVWECLPAVSD